MLLLFVKNKFCVNIIWKKTKKHSNYRSKLTKISLHHLSKSMEVSSTNDDAQKPI